MSYIKNNSDLKINLNDVPATNDSLNVIKTVDDFGNVEEDVKSKIVEEFQSYFSPVTEQTFISYTQVEAKNVLDSIGKTNPELYGKYLTLYKDNFTEATSIVKYAEYNTTNAVAAGRPYSSMPTLDELEKSNEKYKQYRSDCGSERSGGSKGVGVESVNSTSENSTDSITRSCSESDFSDSNNSTGGESTDVEDDDLNDKGVNDDDVGEIIILDEDNTSNTRKISTYGGGGSEIRLLQVNDVNVKAGGSKAVNLNKLKDFTNEQLKPKPVDNDFMDSIRKIKSSFINDYYFTDYDVEQQVRINRQIQNILKLYPRYMNESDKNIKLNVKVLRSFPPDQIKKLDEVLSESANKHKRALLIYSGISALFMSLESFGAKSGYINLNGLCDRLKECDLVTNEIETLDEIHYSIFGKIGRSDNKYLNLCQALMAPIITTLVVNYTGVKK